MAKKSSTKKFSPKMLIIMAIMGVGLVLGIGLVKKNQENRSKATAPRAVKPFVVCGTTINTCNGGILDTEPADTNTVVNWTCKKADGVKDFQCTLEYPEKICKENQGECQKFTGIRPNTGDSCNTSNGTVGHFVIGSENSNWHCDEPKSKICCVPEIDNRQDGVCDTSTINACKSGILDTEPADTDTAVKWTCKGVQVGKSDSCEYTQKINGVCDSTDNKCISGTLIKMQDTNVSHNWECKGINGGSSMACRYFLPKYNFCISGQKRCSGDTLQICKSNNWVTETNCGVLKCNSKTNTCNTTYSVKETCNPSVKQCDSFNKIQKTCNESGDLVTYTFCKNGCDSRTTLCNGSTSNLKPCTEDDWKSTLLPEKCPSYNRQIKTYITPKNCDLKASNSFKPKSLRKIVNCKIEPVCTPNTKQCSDKLLQICNADGKSWSSIDCGSIGCNSNTNTCKTKSGKFPCTEADWKSIKTPQNCPKSGKQIRTWILPTKCDRKSPDAVNHQPLTQIIKCDYQ